MYAIGTAPNKLLGIKEYDSFNEFGEYNFYIHISYDIIQSDCTLFNNKCEAEEILEHIKNKDNIITLVNGNIFAGIEEFDEPEPKIEDLKIYRLNIEEAV